MARHLRAPLPVLLLAALTCVLALTGIVIMAVHAGDLARQLLGGSVVACVLTLVVADRLRQRQSD